MVRGLACRISWPTWKSSKKLPARALPIASLRMPRRGCRATDQPLRPERDGFARLAAGGTALTLLAGCGGPDLRERELCARALTVLDPEAGASEPVDGAAPGPVTLRYAARGRSETLTCRFAPDATGAPEIAGVAGTAVGELSAIDFFFLSPYVLLRAEVPAAELGPLTYLAQQLVNATGLAAVYALLALGYSLLYGLIGRVNLALRGVCAFGTRAPLPGATLPDGPAPGGAAVAAV